MNPVKSASHLQRYIKASLTSSVIIVRGFPRSGTTMAADLCALSSGHFFDRDNILPATGNLVWHTHWRIDCKASKTIYVLRDPIDVAISGYFYKGIREIKLLPNVIRGSLLQRNCSWLQHVEHALSTDSQVFYYSDLIREDTSALYALARVLELDTRLPVASMKLINERKNCLNHSSDLVQSSKQENYKLVESAARELLQREKEFYDTMRTSVGTVAQGFDQNGE